MCAEMEGGVELPGEMLVAVLSPGDRGDDVGKFGLPLMRRPLLKTEEENRSLIFRALVSILDCVRALMMMMVCRRTQKPSHIVPADAWKKRCSFPRVLLAAAVTSA